MRPHSIFALLACLGTAALLAVPATARCDAILVGDDHTGTIGEYTTAGATINASLITGVYWPDAIAVSGGDVYVLSGENTYAQTIGEYTLSGAVVNASLVSLASPSEAQGIAIVGGDIFVASDSIGPPDNGTIAEYDATTGATINSSLVGGLSGPSGIVEPGGNLFVPQGTGSQTTGIAEYTTAGAMVGSPFSVAGIGEVYSLATSGSDLVVVGANGLNPNGVVGEYTASGATVNSPFATEIEYPTAIAVSGSDVFLISWDGNVGEYTTSGATISNNLLVQRVGLPAGIAVIPEPSSMVLLAIAAIGLALTAWWRR